MAHRHLALIGGRAAVAAVYPPHLCRAILREPEAQRRRAGQVLREAVLAEMTTLGLVEPVAWPAPAGVAPPAGVDLVVVNGRLHYEEGNAQVYADEGV